MLKQRPNILLILTDQQRGDCLGIDGHPVLQTPNLDWLAASGAYFRRAYTECPSCIPARRVLMGGQEPSVNGMVGMTQTEWSPRHTMAGELSRAGYQTEMVGKLHLYPYRKRYGFEHLVLSDATHEHIGAEADHNEYLDWLTEGGAVPIEAGIAHGASPNGWIGRPNYLSEDKTHTFWCVTKAIEFLHKRDPEAPFFLNVSFIDPHPPLTPPQWYYDRYVARTLPPPVIGDWAPQVPPGKGVDPDAFLISLDEETMRCTRAAYYGMINHVDDQVGRLVRYLQRRRLLENTFILFASDHGEMLGDHHMFRKTFAYEGSARVPFFARAPRSMGEYPAGMVLHRPVGLQDVMPTLLEVAGVPAPQGLTGASLLPLMRGDSGAQWRPFLHGEHAGQYRYDHGVHYLVDERFKYIWYSQTGREQLFDLDSDPQELHDLARAADQAESILTWRQRLAEKLRDRPEGFSDGDRLIVGQPHRLMVESATPAG